MLMGVAAGGDQWKVEPIGEPKTDLPVNVDEMQFVSLATEHRLDLKAAEWEVQSGGPRHRTHARRGIP